MRSFEKRNKTTKAMVLGAILTALVVVLQMAGSFIHFGMFSMSLVLIPIVIGAATCGPKISAWLGFVFGVVVLITDASAFLAVSVAGTVFIVLLKGIGCGLVAGIVYKLLEKRNRYVAIMAAAVVCPLINTGIFLIGCKLFFFETISAWGAGLGYANAVAYMFLGLAGVNFLLELLLNIVLCPVIIRVINIQKAIEI